MTANCHKECPSALPVELLQNVLSYVEVPVCKSCSNRFETDLSISNNYRNPHRLPVGCTTCPGFVCFGCVYISYSKCYCFLSSLALLSYWWRLHSFPQYLFNTPRFIPFLVPVHEMQCFATEIRGSSFTRCIHCRNPRGIRAGQPKIDKGVVEEFSKQYEAVDTLLNMIQEHLLLRDR